MFLDTPGILCCYDASDSRHQQAVNSFADAPRRFTHNYVLAELVALVTARRIPRSAALRFVWELANSPDVDIQWVSTDRHQAAMTLLLAQSDKQYSLADAVSFVLMRERNDFDALTTDHHFDEAGFRRLLPS
jgi:predicted nucleic acid-binding protein